MLARKEWKNSVMNYESDKDLGGRASDNSDKELSVAAPTKLLEWAWEFLRRNPKYKAAYARWYALPEFFKDEGMLHLAESGMLDDHPVDWFELQPEPVSGENFGAWYRRQMSFGEVCSYSASLAFDPASYMLVRWLDPSLKKLPSPVLGNFFVPDLELEEARALIRYGGLPQIFKGATKAKKSYGTAESSNKSENTNADKTSSHLRQINVTNSAFTPITTTFPDGATELRWPNLIIFADRPTQVALRFDHSLPLDMQLASAERQLLAAKRDFELTSKARKLNPFRKKEQPQAWPQMLLLLDARERTDSDSKAVESYLKSLECGRDLSDKFDGLLTAIRRARAIRDDEYRGLIMRAFEIE